MMMMIDNNAGEESIFQFIQKPSSKAQQSTKNFVVEDDRMSRAEILKSRETCFPNDDDDDHDADRKANNEAAKHSSSLYASRYSGIVNPSSFPTFGVNGKRSAATFGRRRDALKPDPKLFQLKTYTSSSSPPSFVERARNSSASYTADVVEIDRENDFETSAAECGGTKTRRSAAATVAATTTDRYFSLNQTKREKVKIKPSIPAARGRLKARSAVDHITQNALDVIFRNKDKEKIKKKIENGSDSAAVLLEEYKKNTQGRVPEYLETMRRDQLKVADFAHTNNHHSYDDVEVVEGETDEENFLAHKQQTEKILREKWAKINSIYQTLPFVIDTPSKRQRKEECERQLDYLERSLSLYNVR